MSLFDTVLAGRRQWLRVGDTYEVTKKPRGARCILIVYDPIRAYGLHSARGLVRTRLHL